MRGDGEERRGGGHTKHKASLSVNEWKHSKVEHFLSRCVCGDKQQQQQQKKQPRQVLEFGIRLNGEQLRNVTAGAAQTIPEGTVGIERIILWHL